MSSVERRERLTGRIDDVLISTRTIPRLAPGSLDRLRNVPDTSSVTSDGLAEPGDVAVMDCGGATDAAVVGALSARWALKAGVAACVVDGAVRDTASIRDVGLPVWCAGTSPQAARYRLEVAELNGPVDLLGVPVHPGDVVVADRDGVAVIPVDVVEQIIEHCERGLRDERELIEIIDAADGLEDLVARTAGGAGPT